MASPSQIIRVFQLLTLTTTLSSFVCAATYFPSIPCSFSSGSDHPPTSIQYYVHALDSGAASVIKPLDSKTSGTFGQAAVFGYRIHEGSDNTSKTLGTIRGFEVYNSMDANDTTILLLNTVVYKDGKYNGTVSMHGQADISEVDYELTVVGGTGSFRGVAGYAAIHNLKTSGHDHVFQHKLYFLSPQSSSCPGITL